MLKSVKTLMLALLIMTAALPAALAAEEKSNTTELQVRGSYQEEISPDIAYINLGTMTEAETVAAAQAKNAEVMTRLYRQLKDLGIDSDYIKTVNYSVTPMYKYDDTGRRPPTVKGYQVNNDLMVTTSPEKAGQTIDTALSAGANNVNNVRFGKKNESNVKNAALAQAVRDAMNKAEAIAMVLNKRVVRVKSLTENSVGLVSPEANTRFYSAITAADSLQKTTPVSAGLVQLTANVYAIIELE